MKKQPTYETNWNNVVENDELVNASKERKKTTRVSPHQPLAKKGELEAKGWELTFKYANGREAKFEKTKTHDELFENRVWRLFYDLGYKALNKDNNFRMYYGDRKGEWKQIDVIAADDETVVIIECKSSEVGASNIDREQIAGFMDRMNGLRAEARKHFGDDKKVKFIFATNNIRLNPNELSRLESKNAELVHWDENDISYYESLVSQLGKSARYQLAGDLFRNTKIPNLPDKIPAVQTKMGNHNYYLFSIEPESLLKISYILHRGKEDAVIEGDVVSSNYQRLIKKSRLQEIKEFVNRGGFFPNSVVISMNSNRKRSLQFEPIANQSNHGAKLGYLLLPQYYRAAFVIDGQHRLYGYSETKSANHDLIPVVAFDNLEADKQVEMFFQINEKQKAVPKSLRETLQADLNWDSNKLSERNKAIASKIVQVLNSDKKSPLYKRIQLAEEKPDTLLSLRIGAVRKAITEGKFLGKYDKNNELTTEGTFELSNKNKTFERLYRFLMLQLMQCSSKVSDDWELAGDGLILSNRGMQAYLRVVGDVVDFLKRKDLINPKTGNINQIDSIVEKVGDLIKPLYDYINNMSHSEKQDLRVKYGSGGETRVYRTFQRAIYLKNPEFCPKSMLEYWEKNESGNIAQVREQITNIREVVKEKIIQNIKRLFGDAWFSKLPESVQLSLATKRVKMNLIAETIEEQRSQELSLMSFNECLEIITYSNYWSKMFKSIFSYSSSAETKDKKEEMTKWLTRLDKITKSIEQVTSEIKKEDEDFVGEIYHWLVPCETE